MLIATSYHLLSLINVLCVCLQESSWASLPTIFTTATTSAWRTLCTTWPQWSEQRPKTTRTHASWPSCSLRWFQSPCSDHATSPRSPRPSPQTSCVSYVLRQSATRTRANPSSSRATVGIYPGTARRSATHSSTDWTITITWTSWATPCTRRHTSLCRFLFCFVFVFNLYVHLSNEI